MNLENSLKRLRIDCIDFYHHHGVSWDSYQKSLDGKLAKCMLKAKEQGMIRHICCSFHDKNEGLMKLIDTGYPEVITLQYNMLDRQLEEGIAHAHEKGIGIVCMGPVGGGRLGVTSEALEGMIPGVKRVPELALRFVLANKNISVALSGMSEMKHVEENLKTVSDGRKLKENELGEITRHLEKLKKMSDLYCSGCNYCAPCPEEVNISYIFAQHNLGKVYGLWDVARKGYDAIGKVPWLKGKNASGCSQCGACEKKCPQKIKIREQLKSAHKALSPS